MGTEKERLELEQKLAWYRELAREYPDGEIALVIRDFIEELERQIHSPPDGQERLHKRASAPK
jgi:hypothetical protein